MKNIQAALSWVILSFSLFAAESYAVETEYKKKPDGNSIEVPPDTRLVIFIRSKDDRLVLDTRRANGEPATKCKLCTREMARTNKWGHHCEKAPRGANLCGPFTQKGTVTEVENVGIYSGGTNPDCTQLCAGGDCWVDPPGCLH